MERMVKHRVTRGSEEPQVAWQPNRVRQLREELMLSKAELARKAGVSTLTIDRIEDGKLARLDTKRKILLALGVKLTDRDKVFLSPRE